MMLFNISARMIGTGKYRISCMPAMTMVLRTADQNAGAAKSLVKLSKPTNGLLKPRNGR